MSKEPQEDSEIPFLMKAIEYPGIRGNLEIFASAPDDEDEDMTILIHGDPEGLRSFADLLIVLANVDQESIPNLPVGAKEHVHLIRDWDLSLSSDFTIVGRLDAKGTGEFHSRYRKRTKVDYRPAT